MFYRKISETRLSSTLDISGREKVFGLKFVKILEERLDLSIDKTLNQNILIQLFHKYNRVRKVHVTHITLVLKTTIMAFIECTELHWQPRAASGHANFVCLDKKILNQDY